MKPKTPLRWSIDLASTETGVHPRTIKQGLAARKVSPGPDGRYGTNEIMPACYGLSPLEQEAKEAKYRQQIFDAQMQKNALDVQEGRLGYVSHMRDVIADILTKTVQIIRHSKLSASDQRRIIAEMGAVKLDPAKLAGK